MTTFATLTNFALPDPPIPAQQTTVHDCHLLELPKIHNRAGNITVIEPGTNFPVPIRRVYYLYDIPGGASRGGHAHRSLYQLVLAASGSFDVQLEDGTQSRTISLNRPYQALLIVPGIWRELDNFSSGAICMVLASELFDETDYIREKTLFFEQKILTLNPRRINP